MNILTYLLAFFAAGLAFMAFASLVCVLNAISNGAVYQSKAYAWVCAILVALSVAFASLSNLLHS